MKCLLDKNENPSLYPEDSCSESRKQLYIINLEFGGDRRVPVLAGKPVWPISESCKASLANQQEMGSFQIDKVGLIGKYVSERLVDTCTHIHYIHTPGEKRQQVSINLGSHHSEICTYILFQFSLSFSL